MNGKSGSAANFDGNSNIDVSSTALNGENFTVSAWVNWSAGTAPDKGNVNTIVASSVSGIAGGPGLLLYVFGKGDGSVKAGDGVGTEMESTAKVAKNDWSHVAFVKSGANVTIYVNGVQAGTSATSVTGTAQYGLRIGGNNNTQFHNFFGAIDELKIFDKALTAEEIAEAMKVPAAPAAASCFVEEGTTIPDADWCKTVEMKIPVSFATVSEVADTISTLKANGSEETKWTQDAAESKLVLQTDFWGPYSTLNKIVLEATFASGAKDTYTITRGEKPAELTGWVFQKDGTTDPIKPQEGWMTVSENGKKVVINHSKMIVDSAHQPWVIYNADSKQYANSTLEFDVTFSSPDSNQTGFINFAPVKVINGQSYEGCGFDTQTSLKRYGRSSAGETYADLGNQSGIDKFEYDTKYHLRMDSEDNHYTAYITAPGGEEKPLMSFDGVLNLKEGHYGFRIWRGGKTITLENIVHKEIAKSALGQGSIQVDASGWGANDVSVPIIIADGDSVTTVTSNGSALTESEYAVDTSASTFALKADYVKKQANSFAVKVTFALGNESTLWVVKHQTGVVQEYIWTPEKGTAEWEKLGGNGLVEMNKTGDAMHLKGDLKLVNSLAPTVMNGEIEITFQILNDANPTAPGALFRTDMAEKTWQAVLSERHINGEAIWDMKTNKGAAQIIWDGNKMISRESVQFADINGDQKVKDIKVKVRYIDDSITLWIDDQFTHTEPRTESKTTLGGMGLILGSNGDVDIKRVEFREVVHFEEPAGGAPVNKSITADGLTVQLAGDFPRVIDYTLNGKVMKGAEKRYNYATINATDYPATATIQAETENSITYHVVPKAANDAVEQTNVEFDVKFTVLPNQILEMLILNIVEPTDENGKVTEVVFGIGLPQQPLISASSDEAGSNLGMTYINKNARCYADRWTDIPKKEASTTATLGGTLPIISNGKLSASMFNNVLIGGDEFLYRGFDLGEGVESVGVWNTEFMYRGLDEKKMLPFPSEPEERELYCRVVITDDTNSDAVVNWQDGANALRKVIGGITPGDEQAARYNFSSGVQQPFLQVADNMKRLNNYIDGFSQQLIFKGYANEGHDSGHSDFEDINRRAGGADDMNVAIAEADKISSNFGIHINHHEAYPEAKMFNDHVISDLNTWYWMDQARVIRREVDYLEGTFQQRMVGTDEKPGLFKKTPNLDFVYVDCWGEDRWGEKQLIGGMMEGGAEIFGNENAADFTRFGVWTHSTAGNSSQIHQYAYNSQKDIYGGSGIYWGGYNRAASMMSWQHNNNVNSLVSQFYTNQLPQKYLMCHDIIRMDQGTGYFTDNITSSNYVITKDGNKITDGQGKIFIPWYDETKNIKESPDPDSADKIYHWNAEGGNSTWTLPASWSACTTVKLYKTTQNGKVLVDTIDVTEGKVTINAAANTPYVVYPGEATADVTEWSVGSPLKDTMFNSRDFSIWQKTGNADIQFSDDSNGVSILTMTGTEAGQVSQTMTGLTVGQKYRVKVDAGAENGKTARITVKNGDKTYMNYLEQVGMTNQYFDDYALGKPVQRMWVDFTATATTAEVILSADACENSAGKVTFMQSRIVKTAEPDRPSACVANETFEYVEQGAYGIFNPEWAADGNPHLSETHLPYTSDTITGDWSLKMNSARHGAVTVRTSPATMRLLPNTPYIVDFNTLTGGTVTVQSESDGTNKVLEEGFGAGHSSFTFTTGDKTDYIVRVAGANTLDDFEVWLAADDTAPEAPTHVTAAAVDNDNAVELTWTGAVEADGRIAGYMVYRDGTLLTTLGNVTKYTDRDTKDETKYTYEVSAINAAQMESAKSASAEVTTKVLPPVVLSGKLNSSDEAIVTFNKTMDPATAETLANYTLTGVANASITAAALSADGKTVTLTLTGMTLSDKAALKVSGVKDASTKGTIADATFTLTIIEHHFKLDEAADAEAVDEIGKTNGTKTANVATVAGKYGNAASFSGSSSYIDVESDALYANDEFTISAWINWNGASGVNAIVGNDISGDASSRGIIFFVDGSTGVLRTNSNACAVVGSADKPVTKNAWHHVAFVKGTGFAQVYLDGEMIGAADVQFGVEKRVPFRIGGSQGGNPAYPFHGGIDEVKIFSTSLSAAAVAELADRDIAETPTTATFDVTTMMLSGVNANMKYSVDRGMTWVDITGETANLSEASVTVANGIRVKNSGNGSDILDSKAQIITLTQARKPQGVTAKDETEAKNDGALVNTTVDMEYCVQGSAEWKTCDAGSTVVAPGVYEVRVAAKGTAFAGESVPVTVAAYTPPTYTPPSNTTTKTEKNEDGSTTKIVTNKRTGVVTETTTYPDGAKIVATTRKDGKTSIEVTVPKDKEKVTVTIPTDKQLAPGEVAVIIHEDGTREVIKTSVPTKDGLRVTLTGNAKLEIIDNSKSFADVPGDHWGADAIAFVTSRELFNGGDGGFQPAENMSRAMLFTVLARLDGQDLTGGETWYENAMLWAKESGVSDGTNPDAGITRESLAVMLYRYAKAEKTETDLKGFSDADSVSDWATEAMAWAVENGIITGKDDTLDPQGNATRAEVAAMLQRFIAQ
ncbi:MAG: LamG-like jellyroll fold domain-containing protein [Oscillospiraceae bacterium]